VLVAVPRAVLEPGPRWGAFLAWQAATRSCLIRRVYGECWVRRARVSYPNGCS